MAQAPTPQALLTQVAVAFGSAEQTLLQPPQCIGSLVSEVSQPFCAFMSQSAKPLWQEAMPQAPLVQLGVPLGAVQTWAQAPQLATSALVATLQPLANRPSQLAKPLLQPPIEH